MNGFCHTCGYTLRKVANGSLEWCTFCGKVAPAFPFDPDEEEVKEVRREWEKQGGKIVRLPYDGDWIPDVAVEATADTIFATLLEARQVVYLYQGRKKLNLKTRRKP